MLKLETRGVGPGKQRGEETKKRLRDEETGAVRTWVSHVGLRGKLQNGPLKTTHGLSAESPCVGGWGGRFTEST